MNVSAVTTSGRGVRVDPAAGGLLARVGRIVETEWINYRHTWKGTTASAFIGPLLYLGAIGFGLGSLVDAGGDTLGTTGGGEPLSYVAFLAPGLVAATAMQVGAGEAIFGTMARIKWRRTWPTAIETPLMPDDVALAHLTWCAVRAAIAATAYAVVTAVFRILPPLQALATVPFAVLGGLALATLLAAIMIRTSEEHAMNAAQRFVVIPMFLFSGVFFPISQLPGWMQAIAKGTPLWHAVVLARRVALGTPTPWGTTTHLAVLVAVTLLGGWVAVRGFKGRLLT